MGKPGGRLWRVPWGLVDEGGTWCLWARRRECEAGWKSDGSGCGGGWEGVDEAIMDAMDMVLGALRQIEWIEIVSSWIALSALVRAPLMLAICLCSFMFHTIVGVKSLRKVSSALP